MEGLTPAIIGDEDGSTPSLFNTQRAFKIECEEIARGFELKLELVALRAEKH